MNRKQLTAVLRELDACQSYFMVLNTLLENNVVVRDYHALAVLAKSGAARIDDIVDRLDELAPVGQA